MHRLLKIMVMTMLLTGSVERTNIALAQDNSRNFAPPTTTKGKQFSADAESSGQKTIVEYLTPGTDPNLRKPKEPSASDWKIDRDSSQLLAGVFLVIIMAVLGWLLWRNRMGGGLFSRKPKDERIGEANADSQDGGPVLEAGSEALTLQQLAKITDPREGLRLLMVQALLRASRQNNIALRRSLTARDVLRRVPKTWPHRSILKGLVARAELVLFGGRDIAREDYLHTIDQAAPLFERSAR